MIQKNPPSLDDLILLEEEAIARFRRDGHVTIRGLLKASELTYYREAINRAALDNNTEKRPLKDRDAYGKAFLQIMNLWQVDDDVRRFTLARRFAGVAADLLGVRHVRIYHDQALYKEPQGGFTPWHQDQYYWPLDTLNTVTMWMPLVDITSEMGILSFASGSHLKGVVENIEISDRSEERLSDYINKSGYSVDRPASMSAGDTSWHYGSTLHHAPGNKSPNKIREVMTVIYFADGAKITEPVNPHQENDRQSWLGGLPPGFEANSYLNPVVY